MKNDNIFKLVLSALFCALVFIFTLISVPTPTVGNVNLGDCMVILSAFLLGDWYGVLASGLGASLCDMANGYAIYAPATFIIKALMVVVIIILKKYIFKKENPFFVVICGIFAEIVMILGYLLYEAFVLDLKLGALANIPFNATQGVTNIIVALLLFTALDKIGILKKIRID